MDMNALNTRGRENEAPHSPLYDLVIARVDFTTQNRLADEPIIADDPMPRSLVCLPYFHPLTTVGPIRNRIDACSVTRNEPKYPETIALPIW